MNNEVIVLNIWQFSLIYLLLIAVIFIMKKCGINQSKRLIIGSIRMTVQLVLAGFILTYIFENPSPVFTITYLLLMAIFSSYTVISRNKGLNRNFKLIIIASLSVTGLIIIAFFIMAIVGVSFFNPQYTIPIGGMIMGNAMNGVSLGVKTFNESLSKEQIKINTLLSMGVTPKKILSPMVNSALEIALIPTINTMMGMGIISLPGMMTGQILSGTSPSTAILYQIAIIIAINVVTCLSVFFSLYFGKQTLYNKRNQITM